MTPEAWHRVEELFDQAVALAPEERDAWLDGQCHGDEELKNEVQSLLHNDLTRGRDPLQSEIR